MLSLSRGLAKAVWPAVRGLIKLPVGESVIQERIADLFGQISELRGLLTDPAQTSVRLVLHPEHMSLRETQRAYTYMNLFGFSVDAVFVNRILPAEVRDPYFDHWKQAQSEYRQQIRDIFAPLRVLEVPLLREEVIGVEALESLANQIYADVDPVAPLSSEQPLRFYPEDGRYILALRVTGVSGGAVDLEKRGDELRIKLGTFRRTIVLPQYVAGMQPSWARVEGGHLKIAFTDAEDGGGASSRDR